MLTLILNNLKAFLSAAISIGAAIAIYYYRWRAVKAESKLVEQKQNSQLAELKTQEVSIEALKKKVTIDAEKADALEQNLRARLMADCVERSAPPGPDPVRPGKPK